MQRVDVEARDDRTRPEGGFAVLHVLGTPMPPEEVWIYLKPVGVDGAAELGMLDGEIRPLEVRKSGGGIELVLGPDVTEHAALAAGTQVEIEIPAAGVWSEFAWPAVTPAVRPKRTRILAGRTELPPLSPATQAKAIEPMPAELEVAAQPALLPGVEKNAPATVPAVAESAAGVAPKPAAIDAEPADPKPVPEHTPPQPKPKPVAATMPAPEARQPAVAPTPVQAQPQPKQQPQLQARPQARPAASAVTSVRGAPMTPAPRAVQPAVQPQAKAGRDTFYASARGGAALPPPAHAAIEAVDDGSAAAQSLLPKTPLAAAAAAAAAVLALQVVALYGSGKLPQVRDLLSGRTPAQVVATTAAPLERPVFDVLVAGSVSPRGVPARDLTAVKTLEYAQAALSKPGGQRDGEEAAFWLRRYLMQAGSDERTRRVLTQLGTIYADATGPQADFGKARQVWEIASAFGDPVAMCFLGTLNENGLGGIPDRATALQWFERSKQAGGCPGIDDALARLKK